MSIDSTAIWAVIVAAVAQFIVGAIWYMPLFGKLWGKIHGFDRKDKKTQVEMQRQMMPLLGIQLVMASATAYILALLIDVLPNENPYNLAVWMWFGFALPTQVSAVIFGGTASKWIVKKIAIMGGGAFVCYMIAAWVLSVLK